MSEIKKSLAGVSRITNILSFALLLLISGSSPLLSVAQLDNRDWNSQNVTPATSSILGEVRAPDNRPVRNARVKLQSLLNGTILFTSTDTAGSFEFGGVPNGSYRLRVLVGRNETIEPVDTIGSRTHIKVTIATKGQSGTGGEPAISVNQLGVPDKARKAMQKAREAFIMNKLADADTYAGEALAAYPRYAVALAVRGIIRLESDPQQACEYLQKAIESDPTYAPAHLALGSAYNHLGRYDDAARTLVRGLAVAPTSWQGTTN